MKTRTKRKNFFIAVPKGDGGFDLYPMKEWLRKHTEHLPDAQDPKERTSHQLRDHLKKKGWKAEEVCICFKPEV